MIFGKLDLIDNKTVSEIKNLIEQCIEGIINVLANPLITRAKFKEFGFVMDEIRRDEEYLRGQKLNETLGRLLKFINNFDYQPMPDIRIKGHYWYFNSKIETLQNCLDEGIIDKWVTENIIVYKIISLLALMTSTHFVIEDIQSLKSYNNIWTNPAILVVKKSSASYFKNTEYKATLIYYRGTENETVKSYFKKEIRLTNTNLAAFKNARTIQDLKAI